MTLRCYACGQGDARGPGGLPADGHPRPPAAGGQAPGLPGTAQHGPRGLLQAPHPGNQGEALAVAAHSDDKEHIPGILERVSNWAVCRFLKKGLSIFHVTTP